MTDVMSALIISVCSVLLIYWVVRIFWLCFSPDRIDRRTFGVIQQATNYKAGYGARFSAGNGVHCASSNRPWPANPARRPAPGNVHKILRSSATIRTIRLGGGMRHKVHVARRIACEQHGSWQT